MCPLADVLYLICRIRLTVVLTFTVPFELHLPINFVNKNVLTATLNLTDKCCIFQTGSVS